MLTARNYVPDRGDFVWLDLDPRQGHEQGGHRPVLVLSPRSYNRRSGLCVICPATTPAKGYPIEVPIPSEEAPDAVVLADHVRCVDWKTRGARLIHHAAGAVLDEVVARLEALIIDPTDGPPSTP